MPLHHRATANYVGELFLDIIITKGLFTRFVSFIYTPVCGYVQANAGAPDSEEGT